MLTAIGAAALKWGFLVLKLFKLSTLFSGLVTYVFLVGIYGWQFALGVILLVLIHEFGHMVAATSEGLPVTAPIFALMGAFVRTTSYGDRRQDAVIAVAGPIAGLVGAAICGVLGFTVGTGRFQGLFFALASFGCLITLLNLLPMHPFDGGKVSDALSPAWVAAAAVLMALLFAASRSGLVFILALVMGYIAYRKHRNRQHFGVRTIEITYVAVVLAGAAGLVLADAAAYGHGLHY